MQVFKNHQTDIGSFRVDKSLELAKFGGDNLFKKRKEIIKFLCSVCLIFVKIILNTTNTQIINATVSFYVKI